MNETQRSNGNRYSEEPADKAAFTEHFDKTYTRIAGGYDWFVKCCPCWRRWLNHILSEVEGPRVLEVSFGTGYLLTHYNEHFEVHGVEYNHRLLKIARQNLDACGLKAKLVHGTVEDLPYPNDYFDSVIVTMAFTGYPDARKAMSELKRVLKPEGKLILVDVNYPIKDNHNRIYNCLGVLSTKLWMAAGDLIRDMDSLFRAFALDYTDREIGGFGSVHLYVATKKPNESS